MAVTNANQIVKNINKIVKSVSKTNDEYLEEMGQRGVATAKKNTPVESGRLRNSMGYTTDKKREGNEDSVRKTNEKDTVVVGTNMIYARKVEFLSKTGSKGFMLMSYSQWKQIAEAVAKQVFRRFK